MFFALAVWLDSRHVASRKDEKNSEVRDAPNSILRGKHAELNLRNDDDDFSAVQVEELQEDKKQAEHAICDGLTPE